MLNSWCREWIDRLWYKNHPARFILWPASWIFRIGSALRRTYLEWRSEPISVPIVIVGNVTVGGVGKTPLVIALAHYLQAKGLRIGIVSRGYGAQIQTFPYAVGPADSAHDVGDEPKLLALKTQCPVVIAPKRLEAVQYLLKHHQSQIIISDDGLQHYAMRRTLEIAVIDGMRGLGSGLCLPAGPLREPKNRLKQVQFIVVNGVQSVHTHFLNQDNVFYMTMQAATPCTLNGETVSWDKIKMPCSAIAGIGHPERFFKLLEDLGVQFQAHKFADHHVYVPDDLVNIPKPVIMTEKDAVKCTAFAMDAMYYLPVEAKLSDEFWKKIWSDIRDLL